MYSVKTRNWNQSARVAEILNKIAHVFGASVYPSSNNDNKYYLATRRPLKAYALWICFLVLCRFSGGWTYIVRPGKQIDGNYKSFY